LAGLLAGTLFLGGCSLQTTGPVVSDYRLKPLEIAPRQSEGVCKNQTIRVSLTLAPDLFESRQLYYADSNFEQYAYTRSRWAESPDRQLRHLFESVLAQSGLYKSVITYNSQAYDDVMLEPKINNFMQYFEPDGSTYVHVDMELTLIDQDSNHVISTLHIDKKVPTESPDALGAVKAFNTIVHESLNETIGWLHDVCKREPLSEKR
jgi:cholesterol transport system auxiliary component